MKMFLKISLFNINTFSGSFGDLQYKIYVDHFKMISLTHLKIQRKIYPTQSIK